MRAIDRTLSVFLRIFWVVAALAVLLSGTAHGQSLVGRNANAAGPILTIYLLSLALSKERFIGTGAWYIFIINWIKVPLNIQLGLITFSTLKLDLILLPFIFIGAVRCKHLLSAVESCAQAQ